MKILRFAVTFVIGTLLMSCAPLIGAQPSDMILISQETHTLDPAQIYALESRLTKFARENGLSLADNGSAGEGSVFALGMKDRQKATSIIVTSPFTPTTFVFGLYSRLPANRLAPQRTMFATAVRTATAEARVGSIK
jgi:hypothetical protein